VGSAVTAPTQPHPGGGAPREQRRVPAASGGRRHSSCPAVGGSMS
jgi:hypothetical protein